MIDCFELRIGFIAFLLTVGNRTQYLYNAEYIPAEVKAELRQAAVSEGLIGGTAGDYNPPAKSTTTPTKSTYQ